MWKSVHEIGCSIRKTCGRLAQCASVLGLSAGRGGRSLLVLATSFLIIVPGFLTSAHAADEQYRFTLDFGYRWIPTLDGSMDLYRSQLDYGEGPKLFGGDFFISAPQGSNRFMDRFELRMNSWGGEPYNTARLRASKTGVYELTFNYQNAVYFNSIPFFANPFFAQGNLQTQHKFDVSQRTTGARLTLRPGKQIAPFVAFDHSDRQGPVRTTLSVNADDFVLGSNLDTRSNDLRGGVQFSFSRFSLLLEQGVRWYGDETEFSSFGPQQGNVTRPFLGRDIVLEEYNGSNDFDATIPFSNAVAVYTPWDQLALRGRVSYSMADLDPIFSETFSGNFFSFPLQAFHGQQIQQASGRVKQPNLLGDFTAEWQPWRRFRIIERVNIRRLHVSGSLLSNSTFLNVDPVLGGAVTDELQTSVPFNTFLALDQDTQELQGQFFITPRAAIRIGHRFERKQAKLEEREFSWDRNVLLTGFSYQFTGRNRIAVDYELGRTDQAIFRTDPLDFHNLRVRGAFSPFSSLEFSGSVVLFDHENELESIDFTADNRSYSAQFTYTPATRFSITGQYQRTDIRTDLLFIIPQTFVTDRSIYEERGDFGQVFISVLLPRRVDLSLGYAVWGTVGNFPLNYHQPLLKLEVPLSNRIVAYGQWNYYGYNEKLRLFPQDYRAHLAVLGFRVSFGE